ncbi:DUF6801 domain-containing protein [Nocardioides sp. SR21]|uniref:DUF6801 domain-containing protein n=1 Tax=Nocardioides sp. SR21 TaxID=2919501 RepID=UPI001FA97C1F|nr:DUF6801 domain-containing protein [Nocardioides sp. SR21]
MNLRKISTRVVVAGATTALAAGALVGVTGTPANAATGSAGYTCSVAGQSLPITVAATGEIPVNSLATGTEISGLAIPVGVDFTLPAAVAQGLKGFGVNTVGIAGAGFGLALGSKSIPVSGITTADPDAEGPKVAGDPLVPITEADLVLPTTGAITEVSTPAPGSYSISLPQSFTVNISTDSLGTLPNVPCTLNQGEDPSIIPFEVTKQGATVTGKAPASVKKKKAFKIVATVLGNNVPATGKVVASEKGKTLGEGKLKNGKVTISIKGIKKPGLHTIDLKYKGDKLTAPAAGGVFVNVKK